MQAACGCSGPVVEGTFSFGADGGMAAANYPGRISSPHSALCTLLRAKPAGVFQLCVRCLGQSQQVCFSSVYTASSKASRCALVAA